MNDRESYIEAFVEKINKDFYTGEYVTENNLDYKKYHVTQQEIRFEAYLTDDELRRTVEAGIDIVEELIRINEEGFDKKKFDAAWNDFKNEKGKYSDELDQVMFVKKYFYTEKILEIKDKVNEIRRVGGAYAMLISNPLLDQTIFVVYDAAVDLWEENNLDVLSIYFLIRTIMRMNSTELNECDEEK